MKFLGKDNLSEFLLVILNFMVTLPQWYMIGLWMM